MGTAARAQIQVANHVPQLCCLATTAGAARRRWPCHGLNHGGARGRRPATRGPRRGPRRASRLRQGHDTGTAWAVHGWRVWGEGRSSAGGLRATGVCARAGVRSAGRCNQMRFSPQPELGQARRSVHANLRLILQNQEPDTTTIEGTKRLVRSGSAREQVWRPGREVFIRPCALRRRPFALPRSPASSNGLTAAGEAC